MSRALTERPNDVLSTAGPAGLDRPRPARLLSRNHVPPHTRRAPEDLMRTRREFLALSAGAVAATALGPRRANAAPKAMTIVRESSFIKAFDDYFAKTLLPEYEKLTGIKMSYEAVSVGGMLTRLTTIAETKSGPEIAMTAINWPHLFDSSLVDVTDLATEIGK